MNLVIGNTSQQSHFYPDDYIKISSRDIDMEWLSNNKFDSVYITFAEQRIYDSNINYINPNFHLTLDIIRRVISNSNKVVVFGTCELWSNCSGTIYNDSEFSFNSNGYSMSKSLLINEVKRLRLIDSEWDKVKIVNPFYFNSSFRSEYFLFGKVFNSIMNGQKIEVGDLDFYRDMIHTKFLVNRVIDCDKDMLVGSGRLFNVKDFIFDLYLEFGMKPEDYIIVNKEYKVNEKFIRPKVDWNYTYNDLLSDTIDDLKSRMDYK